MTDLTPEGLRAAADVIASYYNIQDGSPQVWRAMVTVVQGARNLADVLDEAQRLEDISEGKGLAEEDLIDHGVRYAAIALADKARGD